MQVNETLVVTFLVIVILILIFSKISIGTTTDESSLIDQKIKEMENKLTSSNVMNTTKNTNTPFDARSSDLLSSEFKKQLDEIQNKFYYDNCRKNKL
jgi:hypothetical protein